MLVRLEEQNARLRHEAEEREEEVAALQDDVAQLTGRINEMDVQHNQKIGQSPALWYAGRSTGIVHGDDEKNRLWHQW